MRRRRPPLGRPPPRPSGESGLITTELAVILFPFIVGCVALVTFAGRVAQAEGDVQSAAQEAARAATLTGNAAAAEAQARDVAAANLATANVACSKGIDVDVDITDFTPGGYVTVTVICTASFDDVAWLRVPGSKQFTSTASEIIDFYRSDSP